MPISSASRQKTFRSYDDSSSRVKIFQGARGDEEKKGEWKEKEKKRRKMVAGILWDEGVYLARFGGSEEVGEVRSRRRVNRLGGSGRGRRRGVGLVVCEASVSTDFILGFHLDLVHGIKMLSYPSLPGS